MKRFDLMNGINTRGTYCCSHYCLPHLKKSAEAGRNPHILTLSPPLNLNPRWFREHVAYTMAKYGMSLAVLGMAEEFRELGIGVNALWPRTAIATAAIEWVMSQEAFNSCRTPAIMSDAAAVILGTDARKITGNFFIDDEVLLGAGLTLKDLDKYAVKPGNELMIDFFIDEEKPRMPNSKL
jgi:citronellol/citronellal dehydrogenase